MMDDTTYRIQNQPLPRDTNNAQLLLQDHLANYQTVQELFNFTTVHAQDVLSRAATSSAVSVSREEIKGFLEKSEGRHDEWRSLWEHHKGKLEESVHLCEFEQAISTVGFDELLLKQKILILMEGMEVCQCHWLACSSFMIPLIP